MNPREHSLLKAISSNIHFLGQCTLMAREQMMSDLHVPGTPCNLIPALRVCYFQTMTSCVQDETLNSWQSKHHTEMKRGLFCLVSSRPKLHKGLGQFKPWGMVVCTSSVFGIPQSWWAQVNHVLLLSLSPLSKGHTWLRKLPHNAWAMSSSFFHWLAWLL
jgi:hypothetical protein